MCCSPWGLQRVGHDLTAEQQQYNTSSRSKRVKQNHDLRTELAEQSVFSGDRGLSGLGQVISYLVPGETLLPTLNEERDPKYRDEK